MRPWKRSSGFVRGACPGEAHTVGVFVPIAATGLLDPSAFKSDRVEPTAVLNRATQTLRARSFVAEADSRIIRAKRQASPRIDEITIVINVGFRALLDKTLRIRFALVTVTGLNGRLGSNVMA